MKRDTVATTAAEEAVADSGASEWLKSALEGALERDPVTALNDALLLTELLEQRLRRELGL